MRWAPLLLAVLLTAPALLPSASASEDRPGGPTVPPSQTLDAGIQWWLDRQDSDGCLDGAAGPTDWGVIAMTSAGHDPTSGDPSLVDGLHACGTSSDAQPDDLARHILAIAAAGQDPRAFDGTDWIDQLRGYWTGNQFLARDHPAWINDDIFAILALRAAGVPASDDHVQGAASFVLDHQRRDGGWNDRTATGSSPSNTDMTAVALQALTAAQRLRPGDEAATRAMDFLADQAKQASGCFQHNQQMPGANTDSTGWAVLGLLTVHEDPRSSRWADTASPWDCLRATQTDDGGFTAGPDGGKASWMATRDALLGLAGVPVGRLNATTTSPSASLSTASTPTEGETTTLVADGVAFAGWQAPDGRVLDGTRVDWRPNAEGEVRFEVLLVGPHGTAAPATFTTTVQAASEEGSRSGPSETDGSTREATPPAVGVPDGLVAERNVTLNLTLEPIPADDPVIALRVDWGNGTTPWQPAATFQHTFGTLGERTLTAWAKDADGDISPPRTTNLTVTDAAPRLTLEAPQTVHRGDPLTLTATARDPDGPTPTVRWPNLDGNHTGATTTTRLDTPGPHTIHAVATDPADQHAQANVTVTALNRAPDRVDVSPLIVQANRTVALTAEGHDPEGDRLSYAWTPPGHTEPTAWGGQYHLRTGPPGTRTLTVNASDPYGGWTTATVTISVQDDDAPGESGATTHGVQLAATSAREDDRDPTPSPKALSPETPRLELPTHLTGHAGQATLIDGHARDPDGTIATVTVNLGGPVPVRGKTNFTARLPALPAGTYTVTAQATDAAGHTSTPQNITLEITDQALAPTGAGARPAPDPTGIRGTPVGLAPLLTAITLAAIGGRRR